MEEGKEGEREREGGGGGGGVATFPGSPCAHSIYIAARGSMGTRLGGEREGWKRAGS